MMIATTAIVSLAFNIALLALVVSILKRLDKIQSMLKTLSVAGEDIWNDNELNTVFIQKALDILSEHGYEPDISVDENGHRWISAKLPNGQQCNVIKLSKELFKSRDFKPIQEILNTQVTETLPALIKGQEGKDNA